MTLLLPPSRIAERRRAAAGPLAPLARSLSSDLAPLLSDGFTIPREKAALSRAGGRCRDDGTLLAFDPFSPRLHRCPRCSRVYGDERDYRWWVMSFQLWLAERAVHGALLRLLEGDTAAGELAESILETYADAYLGYPNRDNVLGPTRLFFSTYLESIWLLQICAAIDLLEAANPRSTLGARVRDRIIAPSSALIRSYDEGSSNRQVWNNAALLASSALLGSFPAAESIVWGPSGLVAHLAQGLLSDGSWYEGENYHLFAHRGLWYGVQIAERLELGLGEPFVAPFMRRFDDGFAASFASALPDLTLPSRRDSQYAISVRQWRFADLCELGLVRVDDPRLRGMLARLYAAAIPRLETGRAQSTAEVERNLPPTALTRADLGWRSLLLASAEAPALERDAPGSVLLAGQGLAVLRRDAGALYIALDYGHSGGGHGHPDRLNLQLAHGMVRWLDDMGTGSYVDPTLHWYRSTLAHNAPLVDGRSQARVHGALVAFEDDGAVGWVDAHVADISPGVFVRRTVIAMEDYLVDVLEWEAQSPVSVDLPIHLDAEARTDHEWLEAPLTGGDGDEDGFAFLLRTATIAAADRDGIRLRGIRGPHSMSAWCTGDGAHEWWRAAGPGAPGNPAATFYLVRAHGTTGRVRTVLDWSGRVRDVRFMDDGVVVEREDGGVHTHHRSGGGWTIAMSGVGNTAVRSLGGAVAPPDVTRASTHAPVPEPPRASHVIPLAPAADAGESRARVLTMGRDHYRRSELPWEEAGKPRAKVRLRGSADRLHLTIEVEKETSPFFAPARETNDLDNEHPDINSDGVQIHLAEAAAGSPVLTWLLVPIADTTDVRITPGPGGPSLEASWTPSARGYIVRCSIALTSTMLTDGFDLDAIVNEMPAERERRRGQLVLSGAAGEWIYLRGDRQPRERLIHFDLRTSES